MTHTLARTETFSIKINGSTSSIEDLYVLVSDHFFVRESQYQQEPIIVCEQIVEAVELAEFVCGNGIQEHAVIIESFKGNRYSYTGQSTLGQIIDVIG